MTITISNVTTPVDFSINELTTGNADGNGVFDIMMKAIVAHLHEEYKGNRIRGTDYANAFIQALNNGLNQATGYALNRAKLGLEMQLTEAQIQKIGADTVFVTKQGALVDAQTIKESLEAEKLEHEIEHKLPRELAMMDAQIENMRLEIALKDYELKYIKPVQLALQNKELDIKDKQLHIMEKELRLKELQIPIMERELALKEKQLEITDKELAIKQQQLDIAKYELEFKLPAEVGSIQAQADLYKQKVITETAQTNPRVIVEGSVIDRNNKVLTEQAKSYDRDGKLKVASLMSDSWKVRRNDDPDEAPVNDINKLNDVMIGKAITTLYDSVGIV